jgi:hypothetical protein
MLQNPCPCFLCRHVALNIVGALYGNKLRRPESYDFTMSVPSPNLIVWGMSRISPNGISPLRKIGLS